MDCSWLVEDDDGENQGSESDPEEAQAELETRLYSIVHHSDLSQPLPPELSKHYSVQCGDDGKLTVVLNNSLENIKLEEVKKVDRLVKDSEPENAISDVEVVEIVHSPQTSSHKRFRYSDVNLDFSDAVLKVNEENKASASEVNYSDINFFKIKPSFGKRKKLLKNLVIPASFQIGQPSNWKDTANESFISVGVYNPDSEKEIVEQMICALKKENPKVSNTKLYFAAQSLFIHNIRKWKKIQKRKMKRAKSGSKTIDLSSHEVKSDVLKQKESFTEHSERVDRVNSFDGCISLNISPFKPLPSTQNGQRIVDLVSEDEPDNSSEPAKNNVSLKWKSLPKSEIPIKWTKKMIKYYTKPSSGKLNKDLNMIFQELKRSSTRKDWSVDPRDEKGIYQRTPLSKLKHRRCANCHQQGHLLRECPNPRKVPVCSNCGLSHHSVYTCPNKLCLKCGVHVGNETFECSTCYFNTFNYDNPCGVCGLFTHRSEICPDLWRSFHATVEGEKKVPPCVKENERKYCCNCAAKGHFSHQCPFPPCDGEQLSSFVTNYSASQLEHGSTDLVVPQHFSHIINCPDADRFLQSLSNSTNAVINVDEGRDFVIRISGTFEQCTKVRNEIEEYVNTKKRKRHEPYPSKKRRKLK